ncbi:SDR family NAD(P)-dependent oxidoreductase [Thiocapsa bogorovii]|uniref:SDR family NAD(P)-dependent oxidoreductase n=1 Tax=Thiocapsa bogorovii TaxID=521689 RepID=UPI002FCAAFA5
MLDYRVLLTARREEQGRAAAAALAEDGYEVSFQPVDVTDEGALIDLRDRIKQHFGRLDVLVNTAGIFPDPSPGSPASSILKAELDVIIRGFETHTLAALRLCQLMIPLMQGRGRVVNVSSGMGQLSEMNGCCPAYRLSKTALNAVTRILADELSDTDIKINSVCPGRVRADMGGANAPLAVEEGPRASSGPRPCQRTDPAGASSGRASRFLGEMRASRRARDDGVD